MASAMCLMAVPLVLVSGVAGALSAKASSETDSVWTVSEFSDAACTVQQGTQFAFNVLDEDTCDGAGGLTCFTGTGTTSDGVNADMGFMFCAEPNRTMVGYAFIGACSTLISTERFALSEAEAEAPFPVSCSSDDGAVWTGVAGSPPKSLCKCDGSGVMEFPEPGTFETFVPGSGGSHFAKMMSKTVSFFKAAPILP